MVRKILLLSVGMIVLGASAAFPYGTYPPAIDLTTLNATFTGTDGVVWNQNISQPTGSGVYDPFLRVNEDAGPKDGIEEGFNTNWGTPQDPVGAHTPPLDNISGVFTHDVLLSDLQKVKVGGIDYYVLTLDINEPNNFPENLLSLDELELYTSASGGGSSFETYAGMKAASTLRYSMDDANLDGVKDTSEDQDVYLDHKLAEGSGKDDLEVLIPASKFAGAGASDYFYLYCKFGATGDAYAVNFFEGDGFEEWSARTGPNPPDGAEPTTMLLLGGGLLGMIAARRRK